MSGLPDVQSLLDDGSGTYPTNVSTSTPMRYGISLSRGRSNELSDNTPGTLALTYENIAGALTPGVGTNCDQGVRIKYTYPNTWNTNVVPAASAKFSGGVGSWGVANGATIATSALHPASDANNSAVGGTTVAITWPTGGLPAAQLNLGGLTIGVNYTYSVYTFTATGQPDIKLQVFGVITGPAISTKDVMVRTNISFTATGTSHFIQIVPATSTTSGQLAYFSCVMVNVTGTPPAGDFNTLTPTTYTRWTGRLQSLPVSWPTGDDTYSVVAATATDALATMARRTLNGAADEVIMADVLGDLTSGMYYPLTEGQRANKAHDALNLQPPMSVVNLLASDLAAFGTTLNTPDGAQGIMLTSPGGVLGTAYLQSDPTGTWVSPAGMHFNFLIDITAGGLAASDTAQLFTITTLSGGAILNLTLSGVGVLTWNGPGGTLSTTISNPQTTPHVVGVQVNSFASDLWVDGVKASTGGGSLQTWLNTGITLGDNRTLAAPASRITFGKFVLGGHRTDPIMLAEQSAMVQDFLAETPTARVTRLCALAGVTTGTLDATGATTLGYAQQAGRSALDCLLESAQADLGDVYADKNGAVSYISGLSIQSKAAPDATISANFFEEATAVTTDMTAVLNDVTGTAVGTDNQFRAYDLTSSGTPGNHGVYQSNITWNVATDAQLVDRVNWRVFNYSSPHPRVGTLTVDLLTNPDPTAVAAALALDLTGYLRITGMPAQTQGGTQLDLIVEGITETISATEWTLSMNVVQRSLVGAWVLDDTTWSVLDSTTKLGVG